MWKGFRAVVAKKEPQVAEETLAVLASAMVPGALVA